MTSEEVNELSKGAIRNMFQEMAIQKGQNDGTERNPKRVDNDQLQKELRLAFPNIDSVFVGWTTILDSNGMSDTLPMFIYSCEHETKDRQMQLNEYLRIRLHADTMILIRK